MKIEHEHGRIREAIRRKYAGISKSAVGRFAYPTGAEGARALGYDASLLAGLPTSLTDSFCGVGNPFLAGPVGEGESLLDVGCGAGLDLIVAARLVGKSGRVCGVDLTLEMGRAARANAAAAGLGNVEVSEGAAEEIPYGDGTFDVVISNGVLNLSPRKEDALGEIFRVLSPGGRLQFADIVLEGETARGTPCTLEAWSD